MKTKEVEMYLKDTDQTKRMKELALNFVYSNNGEMFRLLSTQAGHDVVKKIKKGVIKLPSKLKYGKDKITTEEKFLENLDNYISYVKNHYFINNIEQLLLLELSLENKYSSILYSDIDFYNCDNYSIYHNEYIRMFFYNFYNNIFFFSELDPSNESFYTLKNELKNLDYDDADDILKIENILKAIIINRNNNLFNSFINNEKMTQKEYQFYSSQVEWVVEDYYDKLALNNFELKENDNYIEVYNDSIILLNISEISDNNRFYLFEFGIKNSNFSAKTSFVFDKKDLKKLIERLEIIRENEYYDESMDFIAAELKMTFWSDRGTEQFLNIEYRYGRDIDYYFISIGQKDIDEFLNLIKKQI